MREFGDRSSYTNQSQNTECITADSAEFAAAGRHLGLSNSSCRSRSRFGGWFRLVFEVITVASPWSWDRSPAALLAFVLPLSAELSAFSSLQSQLWFPHSLRSAQRLLTAISVRRLVALVRCRNLEINQGAKRGLKAW